MGAKDRMNQAASDLARGVTDAVEDVTQKARSAVGGLMPRGQGDEPEATSPSAGSDPANGSLREVHPDPSNKAGIRDSAGDRVDHS